MARQEAQFPCLSLRQNLRWLSDKKYIFKSRRPLSDLYAGSGWNACQLPVGAISSHRPLTRSACRRASVGHAARMVIRARKKANARPADDAISDSSAITGTGGQETPYQAGVQQYVGASSNSAAFILAVAFSPPSNISEIIPLYSAVSRISGFIDPAGDPDDAPFQDLIGDWPCLTQARCFLRPLRADARFLGLSPSRIPQLRRLRGGFLSARGRWP